MFVNCAVLRPDFFFFHSSMRTNSLQQQLPGFEVYFFLFVFDSDVDTFISQTLKGENLSKKAKEKREVLLKKIKDVKAR